MAHTMLALHAHPDDEALLTSGTMARAAAQGHRVLLAVATDGDLGLTSSALTASCSGVRLGDRRMAELRASAAALGVEQVFALGYADSGHGEVLYPDPPGLTRFVRADLQEASGRLAEILQRERVDVLLSYDANGGYGHRDHVKVHQVGARAAELAGTPRLLEATIPRDTICRAIDLAARVYRFPPEFDREAFTRAYSPRSAISYRVNVVRYTGKKRAAMRAHASQSAADQDADRTLAAFLRIPRPLYDIVFGREWYAEPAATAGRSMRRDIFDGLR